MWQAVQAVKPNVIWFFLFCQWGVNYMYISSMTSFFNNNSIQTKFITKILKFVLKLFVCFKSVNKINAFEKFNVWVMRGVAL